MKTTEQLLKLNVKQVNRMTESELRQAVSTLRSTSRKRYERIVEKEVYSPAIKELWRGVTNDVPFPTVRNMDMTTLVNEYKRYSHFLKLKTSTVRGARKFQQGQKKGLVELTGVEFSDEDTVAFWELYDKAKNTGVGGVLNYRQVAETTAEVYEEHPNWNSKKIISEVEKRLNKIYESENEPPALYPSKSM